MAKKGVPKRDVSGGGTRANKGRGGCKTPRSKGKKPKGWEDEPARHSLAAHGVRTKGHTYAGLFKENVGHIKRDTKKMFANGRGTGEIGKLPSEIKTAEMGKRVLVAAKAILKEDQLQAVFEHGHWWVTDFDGNIWDAVDASGPGTIDGFDMELVSEGDEGVGSHWRHK